MKLEKYSFGIGDRFGKEGRAQLRALLKAREKGIKVGANVMMPNVTPGKYRDDYKLYDNKPCIYITAGSNVVV